MRTNPTTRTTVLLWTAQVLLAALFVFAGVTKLMIPAAELEAQAQMSGTFLHFIGVVELFGGIGVLLPTLLRIRPGLAPLAAAGLVVVMIGATVTTAMTMSAIAALIPFVTGCVAAFVAYGRWKVAPVVARRGSQVVINPTAV